MDTVDLGYLLLTLGIDSTQYEKQLESARKKAMVAASSIEAGFAKSMDGNKIKVPELDLVPRVDHSELYELNKHLDSKAQHVDRINSQWATMPLTVRVDDSELVYSGRRIDDYSASLDSLHRNNSYTPIILNLAVTSIGSQFFVSVSCVSKLVVHRAASARTLRPDRLDRLHVNYKLGMRRWSFQFPGGQLTSEHPLR